MAKLVVFTVALTQLIFFGRESDGEGWLEIEARGGSGVRYRACDAAEAPAAARGALDR